MTQLRPIPVRFDAEAHTYTHTETGRPLQGITSTLLRRLFPDKYKDIPEHILANAAKRGHAIHEEIEISEFLEVEPQSQEAKNYFRLKFQHGLCTLRNEWLVSDLEHYASQIDVVFQAAEGMVHLADIKTTAKFDELSVSWQLSIYSYLLRLNNPEVKVDKLYGIWLRGEIAQLIEVPHRSDDEIKALIRADQADEPFAAPSPVPSYIREAETAVAALTQRIATLTVQLDEVKASVAEKMEAEDAQSYDTRRVLFTRVSPQQRTTFETTRFKEQHPDLYASFTKTTQTKPSLRVTVRSE